MRVNPASHAVQVKTQGFLCNIQLQLGGALCDSSSSGHITAHSEHLTDAGVCNL